MYVVTGNGDSNAGLNRGHAGINFDSSDVKLDTSLRVIDYFTPAFQNMLNENDLDLSVSGPMIPSEWRDSRGNLVRRLLHGSKQGILYNLNRDNMGHFHKDSNPIQQVSVFDEPNPGDTKPKLHIHSTPTFWQAGQERRVYVASDWGLGIRAYRLLDNGQLETTPFLSARDDRNRYAFNQLSLSANGSKDGVLWTVGCVSCVVNNPPGTNATGRQGVLLAYDASRLGNAIFTSSNLGVFPRFNSVTIANGRVYVPTFSDSIAVFGLSSAHFAAIWTKPAGPAFVARHGLTPQQYQQQFDQLVGQQGYCLVDVSGYEDGGQLRYAAIWRKTSCAQFVARHGLTSQEYQQQFDQLVGHQGYRLKLVDGYTVSGQDRYAAIWEKSDGPPFVARHGLTSQQYQQQFDDLVERQGYCLAHVSGYAVGNEDRYAAIWEKKSCAPFAAIHGLSAQQYQQRFDDLVGRQGYRLIRISGHRINGQDSYAAIFEKSPGPAFVARHGLSADEYQKQFDQLVGREGYGLEWISGY